MASNIKNIAKSRWFSALMDMDEAGDTIRARLLMTNTTYDTDVDTDAFGSYTLDDFDGSGAANKDLDNQTVSTDDANDRAEFTSDALTWSALGNGTRQIQGMALYEFITDDAGSFGAAWIEFASTINPGGSDLTVSPNAEGWLQLT